MVLHEEDAQVAGRGWRVCRRVPRLRGRGERQPDPERRAEAFALAVRGDRAPVHLHQAPGDRQPEPQPAELPGHPGPTLFEGVEEPWQELTVDPLAAVLDRGHDV